MVDAPAPPDDDAPECDGIAHAWRILPGDWREQLAVASCCGIRAVSRFGGPYVLLDEGVLPASLDQSVAPSDEDPPAPV